ncbi:hypothetical protein [Aquimarina rhabdastrellae]
MKRVSVIVMAAFFLCASLVSAANTPVKKTDRKLSDEIGVLLKDPSFKIEEDIKAQVTFTLNKDNEIVVLSVESESVQVEGYIKNRLNYQKVKTSEKNSMIAYQIPVRIVQE